MRARILRAMAELVAERGFGHVTVKELSTRAGVSTRTFYTYFNGLEDCFAVVLDLGLQHTTELIRTAFEQGEPREAWQDGMRRALARLLAFLDGEPALARCWLVESLTPGSWAHEQRERNLARLRDLVLAQWPIPGPWRPPPLTTDGVMGSVQGVIHAHLITNKPEPLTSLLGPLMSIIVAPYLGPQAAERELDKTPPPANTTDATGESTDQTTERAASEEDQATSEGEHGAKLTARARECLLFLAERDTHGAHPSNREIAAGIGVAHESQIARLLAHLHTEGLIAKHSLGPGKRNAWRLTQSGEEAVRRVADAARPGGAIEAPGFRLVGHYLRISEIQPRP